MRQMVVTGLSNEQDFQTGESSYVLILNKEIRVPVSEELATRIIQAMYGDSQTPVVEDDEYKAEEGRDEDKVPYHPGRQSNGTQDEDGIDQI